MAPRARHLRHALWLSAFSIVWSGIAGSIAVWVALAGGSLSLLGFGFDALVDSVASAILIWRFLIETRQPERAARVEHIAERVIGVVLVSMAVYLVAASLRSLAAQSHADGSTASLALLVASVLVLPALARAKYLVALRLESRALRADSILTAVAAALAAISLASLAAADAFGFWWADAAAALIVAVLLLREGWSSLTLSRSAA
jgi:divalent metal cation (Fe/Co/Zn/Cd) transporter